jgi:hypothetical protein
MNILCVRHITYVLISVLSVSYGFAQTGSISGRIHDEQSGEEIVGANVLVVGTKLGAATDIDGKFLIRNAPAGKYSLRISFVGYASRTITDVIIKGGETLTLDVNIASAALQAEEVTVTAERVRSTESALLSERKKATTIGDGISAEQIKRTPDATSGDALKRVTGVSVVDNKFVFIRGITDRYNGTTLDGASVTSTEAGKKGFSFDLLPANLLENTVVVKSATPDLPGDFTGGLVQMNTLDFPDRRVMKLNLSSSYNSLTTTRGISTSQGNRSFFGFDDGGRSLSGDITNPIALAQSLPNTWAPRNTNAPFNGSFSLAYGDRLIFDDEDPSNGQLGFIGAFSYRNSYQRSDRIVNDRDLDRYTIGPKDEFNVLWGGLANVSYKFSGIHKISVKNSYNHSAEDNVTRLSSRDQNNSLDNLFTIIGYSQRSVYTGQIIGDHTLPEIGGLTVQWRGSVSSSARQDPDRKEVNYYRGLDDPTAPYTVGYNKRSWSKLNDQTFNGGIDFALPVAGGKVKFGAVAEKKTSNYGIRYFRGAPDYFGGASDSLTQLPLEHIYSPQNYGAGKFLFSEISSASDSYEGKQTLYSGYVMIDMQFEVGGTMFRATGGARLENSTQVVGVPTSPASGSPREENELKNVDILPSMNLTYIMSDNMNLRLAYSHSVNRPEFRERAATIYEDFIKNEIVGGNPNLARAYVHNYDVRYEVFPSVGEVLAVSYFEKHISGAIEEQLLISGTRSRVHFNSGSTRNSGLEFEFRKSLGFLGEYWSNLSLTGNYTRVQSHVEFTQVVGNSSNTQFITATRPMQGQSPYMINFSLLFTEPMLGTSVSILYNKFGQRLNTVGFNSSDIYEEPRDVIDLAVTQSFTSGLEGKFTVKNLTGKDRVLTRDGSTYEQTATGVTYSLQVSLSL